MVALSSRLLALGAILFGLSSASRCSPSVIEKPEMVGASILGIQAQEVHNYSASSLGLGTNEVGRYTISFCNVTVTHTHPGWNDEINTQIWLPLKEWNGRFQGLGGGGYSAGLGSIYLTYAVAQGFASASTDGGVDTGSGPSTMPTDLSWVLSSEGNINWSLLEDYATKATNDMAIIGQQITKSYYRQSANYSYFAGCSGGGRQALMMAQKYPDVFDGILAVAPAINIQRLIPSGFWASLVMQETDAYPAPCEVSAFIEAATKACDGLDGVEDGIISSPELCTIKASDFTGKNYSCHGVEKTFTASNAKVIQAAWSGSQSVSKQYGWHGLNKDADISSNYVSTSCSGNGTCHATDSDLLGSWFKYLVAKSPAFRISSMTKNQFFNALHSSIRDYTSMLGSNDADLSNFKRSGGKMISWHGLTDEIIPPNGTTEYYESVLKGDPRAHKFYRSFEAPGVGHCFGGLGPVPNEAMSQLIDWVENDHAPAVLHATKGSNNTARDLCPYPLRQKYIGGDSRNATSFNCI